MELTVNVSIVKGRYSYGIYREYKVLSKCCLNVGHVSCLITDRAKHGTLLC